MRIDAHQHFWRYDPEQYGWIGEGMEVLRRDFLPGDLERELGPRGLAGSVAVQARQTLEETRWLLELADEHPIVRGVVGWVDLTGEDVERELEDLAVHPSLKGLRHIVQDEPDDDFLLRGDFRRGLAALARHGLTYDLLIHVRHLPRALELVRSLPGQPFVLDHLAKPEVRAGRLEPWARDLRALAAEPNVSCKLSGLVTEADWSSWRPEQLVPYLDLAYEAFGEERVMFGSDWPVCTLAASYGQVLEALEAWARPLGERARARLMGENAAAFYGL